jgi:cytochrome c nitrite reductase small subunit
VKRFVKIALWSAGALLLALLLTPPILSATPAEPKYLCASCHTMAPWYDSYRVSAHGGAVTCSDCHSRHGLAGLAQKYTDGARHVLAELAGVRPEAIRLSPDGLDTVMANCASCHATVEHARDPGAAYCISCHADEPHGTLDLGLR